MHKQFSKKNKITISLAVLMLAAPMFVNCIRDAFESPLPASAAELTTDATLTPDEDPIQALASIDDFERYTTDWATVSSGGTTQASCVFAEDMSYTGTRSLHFSYTINQNNWARCEKRIQPDSINLQAGDGIGLWLRASLAGEPYAIVIQAENKQYFQHTMTSIEDGERWMLHFFFWEGFQAEDGSRLDVSRIESIGIQTGSTEGPTETSIRIDNIELVRRVSTPIAPVVSLNTKPAGPAPREEDPQGTTYVIIILSISVIITLLLLIIHKHSHRDRRDMDDFGMYLR
ncbi:MAG TPA: hypothetical protein PKL83_04610 [bacterium]|nr:hypothetical protein [bacterium]